MGRTRIGVVGLGWISQSFVLPVYSRFDDVELAAFCDTDETRLRELADRYGVPGRFTGFNGMAEAGGLDGVIVSVYPGMTAEISRCFLEKGIAAYIEKPPGITTGETRGILGARQDTPAMVAFNRRYMPVADLIRGVIAGRGPLVQLSFEFYKSLGTDPSASETAFDPLVGTIIHGIDLMRYLAGEVETAGSVVKREGPDVANSFTAALRFAGGVSGTLNAFWNAGQRLERYTFHGQGWSIVMDSPEKAMLRAGKVTEELVPPSARIGGVPGEELPGFGSGFPQELRAFIELVRNGQQTKTPLEDALRTMELVDTIRNSAL